jgi:hypothetical protein
LGPTNWINRPIAVPSPGGEGQDEGELLSSPQAHLKKYGSAAVSSRQMALAWWPRRQPNQIYGPFMYSDSTPGRTKSNLFAPILPFPAQKITSLDQAKNHQIIWQIYKTPPLFSLQKNAQNCAPSNLFQLRVPDAPRLVPFNLQPETFNLQPCVATVFFGHAAQ